MTKVEFVTEYKRLIEEYENIFKSKNRMALIEQAVMPLSHKWWKGVVDRIIISNNPKMDIYDAARSEAIAINAIKRTKENIEAYEYLTKGITDEGLKGALNAFGAKSIWEAILTSKSKNDL